MSELELPEPETDTAPETQLDRDDHLRPEFVRAVLDAVENGNDEAARALVEPLHPADIADLLELLEKPERYALAAAITDLMTGEVIAELNDYVRDEMMEALPAAAVATIAEQLDTDDAVQLIEDLQPATSAPSWRSLIRKIGPPSKVRWPTLRNPLAA